MSEVEATWWPDAVLDRSRWGELVEPALVRIAAARDRGRFPHAMLLVGPQGLGRELAAVEAAVMLVCDGADEPWSVSPCADRARRGVHPDVVAMLPEGKGRVIKIDPLRDGVVEVVGARPYEGRRRVWIFDGVEEEHFPSATANAFLKTLEEPPEHAVFVLLAANPTAVLPTIRSRCQQLKLPGAAMVAGLARGEGVPQELASAVLNGSKPGAAVAAARAALEAAARGEPRQLLTLPYTVGEEANGFVVAAVVATEMAVAADDDGGEGLVRLAADLLATERRCRALNLDRNRQLSSCLMRWYREL